MPQERTSSFKVRHGVISHLRIVEADNTSPVMDPAKIDPIDISSLETLTQEIKRREEVIRTEKLNRRRNIAEGKNRQNRKH